METFFIKAAQFVLSLSLLIIIHEFGHYLFARLFGIKVDKFYLFFNPWFTLFKWKPKPKKRKDGTVDDREYTNSWRDTEYGIGWLPLGGYCKISGMIDESMDKEQMAQEPKPWEFRTKAAYKRLLVMLGGVLFNFILAIIIYAGIVYVEGNKYVPYENAYAGMDYIQPLEKIGFKDGDILLSADGKKLDVSKGDGQLRVVEAKEVKVLRNGADTVAIAIPENFIFQVKDSSYLYSYRQPVIVKRLSGGGVAQKAGLKEGDHIVKIGDEATPSYTELHSALLKYAGKTTTVTVERGDKEVTMNATPTDGGKLEFELETDLSKIYDARIEEYGLLESIPKGWELGTTTLGNYVGQMKYVFTKEGVKSLGGFGTIGDQFSAKWDWLSFWQFTAFLSVALAFMNIIPIPGLDGGHVLFLLWEIVTRRKPSEKVMEWAQMVGMAFLLILLLYANGMDIVRAIF